MPKKISPLGLGITAEEIQQVLPDTTDQLTEGNTNLYFTAARTRAVVLTGFSAAAGVVAATDTLLQAINKVLGNVSSNVDTDKASTTKYPSAKATYDWATALFTTLTTAQTLTSKRITRRVVSVSSHTTPTLNTDITDVFRVTALTEDITSMTTNLTGTPVEGDELQIEITGTAARAIAWGASFESSTVTLPVITVTTQKLITKFVWNSVSSKWRIILVA